MTGTITTVWGQVLPGWVGGLVLLAAVLVIAALFVYTTAYYRGARWMLGEVQKHRCAKWHRKDEQC